MEYKAPTNAEWSAWKEIGTDVSDFGAAAEILKLSGLKVGLLLDRVRRTAVDGSATLSLDEVKGLGRFLEIEVEADDANDHAAQMEIKRVQSEVGLQNREAARPYGEILLHRLENDEAFRVEHEQMIRDVQ